MKKLLGVIMLITISNSAFCQFINSIDTIIKVDLLQKSKKQKIAAWILLGGGAALTAIGTITAVNNSGIFSNENDGKFDGGIILTGLGVSAMAGSIPLFVASARNKKKAMEVSANFKMENYKFLQQNSFANKTYPAVSVTLYLK